MSALPSFQCPLNAASPAPVTWSQSASRLTVGSPFLGLPRWAASAFVALLVTLLPMPGLANQPNQPPPAPQVQMPPAQPGQQQPAQPGQQPSSPAGQTITTKSAGSLPKPTLGTDATIRLPVGAAGGVAKIVVNLENLPKGTVQAGTVPVLEDRGGVGSASELATAVEFANPEVVGASDNSCAWLWTVRLKNLAPNSSQKRFARFSYGNQEQYLEYTVTNQSPAAFTWSVAAAASPWIAWFGLGDSPPSTAVVVTTGDYPATNFRLAQSTLQNSLGTAQIGLKDLELSAALPASGSQFSINPRSIQTFFVRLKTRPGQSLTQPGKYTGTLSFAVDERPDLQTVNVTLQVSSLLAKGLGALLVGLGIYVAWRVTVKARARLLRLEALKPAVALRETIADLFAELDKIQVKLGQALPQGNIRAKLTQLDNSLDPSDLDKNNFLPPEIPRPFPGGTDTSAKFKTFLEEQDKIIAGLSILIKDGMSKIAQYWTPTSQHQAKIIQALQSLDRRVDEVIDRPSGEKVVKEEHANFQSSPEFAADTFPPVAISPLTTQSINWEIGQLYTMGWLIWGLLSLLGGVAVLILTSPGFGTALDMIFCFFWGFGLPTAIDKLQQLGPTGIATSIGITQIKTTP